MRIILEQKYFQLNNIFYKQFSHWGPHFNPLLQNTPTVHGTKQDCNVLHTNHITGCYSYVDNILIVYYTNTVDTIP
jgi:hypothetical protein